MTTKTELRTLLLKLKAKTTPNKYIREHNDEYWQDIYDAEDDILTLLEDTVLEVIGVDEPHKFEERGIVSVNSSAYRNNLRAEQRQRLVELKEQGFASSRPSAAKPSPGSGVQDKGNR